MDGYDGELWTLLYCTVLTPLLIGAGDGVVEEEAEGHGEEHAAGQDHGQDVVQGGVTSP